MANESGRPEYDYDKEYERKLASIREQHRLDDEELKHELWSCKVGDLLEQIAALDLVSNEGVKTDYRPMGQIYCVVGLKGRGFDLELVSSEGSREIRAMNAEIPGSFRVLPQP